MCTTRSLVLRIYLVHDIPSVILEPIALLTEQKTQQSNFFYGYAICMHILVLYCVYTTWPSFHKTVVVFCEQRIKNWYFGSSGGFGGHAYGGSADGGRVAGLLDAPRLCDTLGGGLSGHERAAIRDTRAAKPAGERRIKTWYCPKTRAHIYDTVISGETQYSGNGAMKGFEISALHGAVSRVLSFSPGNDHVSAGFWAVPVFNASLADGLRRQLIPDRCLFMVRHPPALRIIEGARAEEVDGPAAGTATVCVSAEAAGAAGAACTTAEAAATGAGLRAENASTTGDNASTTGDAAVRVPAGAPAAISDTVRATSQATDRSPATINRRAIPPRHSTYRRILYIMGGPCRKQVGGVHCAEIAVENVGRPNGGLLFAGRVHRRCATTYMVHSDGNNR